MKEAKFCIELQCISCCHLPKALRARIKECLIAGYGEQRWVLGASGENITLKRRINFVVA